MMGESAGYRTLLRVAAVAALVTVVVTVAQIVAFAIWPPPSFAPTPSAALRFFGIAQARPLFAFVQLDGLTLIDYLLLIPVYLALYVALRHENPSLMLIGTVLSLFAITLYFTVNPAPAILVLAREYGAADSEAARSSIVSAGVGILAVFQGAGFLVHYVVMGVAGILVSLVMLRSAVFSRATAIAGLLQGVMMLIPSTFGVIGLVLALGSLVPFVVWFALIALRLWRLGGGSDGRSPSPA
jgi:hypothetical protein